MTRKPPREPHEKVIRYLLALPSAERKRILAAATRKPRELLTAAEHLARHRPGRPLKAAADPEVRAFIDHGLRTMSFKDLAGAAREKFGPARAPSKGAIHRYWMTLSIPDRDRISAGTPNPAGSGRAPTPPNAPENV